MAPQPAAAAVAAAVTPDLATAPLPDPRIAAMRISFHQLQNSYQSRSLALSGSERDAFDGIGGRLIQHYLPQNPEELRLIAELQSYEWLRGRNVVLQVNVFSLATERKLPEAAERFPQESSEVRRGFAMAAAYFDTSREMTELSKEMGRLTRLIEKTRKELRDLIYDRERAQSETEEVEEMDAQVTAEAPEVEEETGPDGVSNADSEPEATTVAEVGFVLQNSENGQQPVAARQPRIKMPRFAGPNKKADRKAWLRAMRKRLAA